jgi:hypothetical protein
MMRTMLRKTLGYLNLKKWDIKLIKEFNKIMLAYPLNINQDNIPDGISYHLTDIFLEELVKYGETLKPLKAVKMIQVFIKLMAISKK